MTVEPSPHRSRSFFAVTRLARGFAGYSAARGEENAWEARTAGVLFYLVAYLWLVKITAANALGAVLLIFGTWLFWLVLLYANSLIVRLLRGLGLFAGLTNARVQNILIGFESLVWAGMLARNHDWSRLVGLLWLGIAALNFAAWVLLAAMGKK